MTTIIHKYVGITHPISDETIGEEEHDMILEAWKHSNCPQGIHLFDECWTIDEHSLVCDACGIEVYIEKIVVPDGKDIIIDNSITKVKAKEM
jgi:hypothetical protein